MNCTGIHFLLALASLLIGASNILHADDLSRLKTVLGGIKQRHENYNPLLLKYRVHKALTKLYFASRSDIDPDDKKSMAKLRDINYEMKHRFAQKGNLFFLEVDGPSLSSRGEVLKSKLVDTMVYDGKLTISTSGEKKAFAISRERPSWGDQVEPFNYNGESDLLGLYEFAASGKLPKTRRLVVSDDVGTVKSAQIRLTVEFENEDTYDAWLTSEGKGCCVMRFERRGTGGVLFTEVTDCRYVVVDGVYFPKTAVRKGYYHKDSVHELVETAKFEADSITLRGGEISDTLFKLAIPPGAEVLDRDTGQRIRDPAEVAQHIDEAIAAVEMGPPSAKWKWFYFAGSVLFLVVLLYVIYWFARRRHRRTAS